MPLVSIMTTPAENRLERYTEKADDASVRKIDAKLLRMHRGRISKIWADVQALWAMIKDPAAAWPSKAIAIGALLYLVSPFDAIPDFIPFFGLSDDAGVILAAAASLSMALAKYHMKPAEKPGTVAK
jgi:uncharacterized membrane protein YkvA (DUF1232 family)